MVEVETVQYGVECYAKLLSPIMATVAPDTRIRAGLRSNDVEIIGVLPLAVSVNDDVAPQWKGLIGDGTGKVIRPLAGHLLTIDPDDLVEVEAFVRQCAKSAPAVDPTVLATVVVGSVSKAVTKHSGATRRRR